MDLKVIDNKGKEGAAIQFDEKLVETKASQTLLHEAVVAHLASQRSGTHSTKTRAEVSGGGIKPWKQKGTGRARAGSIRSPLWRHGGTIFGPKPRSYSQPLNKKKKRTAFRLAIANLIKENKLVAVEPLSLKEPKTKLAAEIFKKWKAPTDSLHVVEKIEASLDKATRNVADIKLKDVESLNTYDCLRARKIFITPKALEALMARISKSVER